MKLALVTPYPVDQNRIPGGVRNAAYHLVQELRRFEDLDVHVFHCHSEVPDDRVEALGNLTLHHMSMPRKRIIPNTIRAVGRIAKALHSLQPDVINAHEAHYAMAGFRSGRPTVYTIHGIAHREAAISKRRPFDRLLFALECHYARQAVQKARHLIAVSPYVIREYGGWTRGEWHLIENPLPDDFFAVQRRVVEGRILFAGSIMERKDILTLLKAVHTLRRRHPHLPLGVRLAGRTTNPGYEKKLRNFIKTNGLEDAVTFLGLLDRRQLLSEYAACAMAVLPSLQESEPMTVMEAMAAGSPVVASRAGGIPDLVEDGMTGLLFPPRDSLALAEAIARLFENNQLCRVMGAEAKRRAQERFRAADVALKYRQVYDHIAGKRRP